jgi:hypothetical protein
MATTVLHPLCYRPFHRTRRLTREPNRALEPQRHSVFAVTHTQAGMATGHMHRHTIEHAASIHDDYLTH